MPSAPSTNSIEAKKYFDSALKSLRKSNLIEAETAIAQAIALDETNAEYWLKLGLVWGKMNRHNEAIEANSMALALSPNSADALYNLGLCYLNIGDQDKGIEHLQQSFRATPSDDLAEKLADLFQSKNDYKSIAYYLLHIYKNKKASTKENLQYRLANALYYNGDLGESLNIAIGLMKRDPNNERYNSLLLDLYRRVPHSEFNQDGKDVVESLLKKKKTKLLFLRNPWSSLFLLDATYKPLGVFVSKDARDIDLKPLAKILRTDFLCLGIQKGLALTIPIENILTNIRRYLLLHWKEASAWPEQLLKFIASLAVGCWYNDFVYFETPEEKAALLELRAHIDSLLKTPSRPNDATPALLISLLACYVPLYEFCESEESLPIARKFINEMEALLTVQLTYPRIEKSIIPTIPAFTQIEDKTSLSVQSMYESRPYPRWISTTTTELSPEITESTSGLEILVAGCGTGHEPALYANILPKAHITAIDLSLPSIAYGKRMAAQLGIASKIDFFHGDLMKVGEMNRTFDFVASSGVLHHLKDPDKGLSAILKTLRPNGRLSISLYSEAARNYVLNPALNYIKEKGYSSSTDDIRQFRQDVMNMSPDNLVTRCTSAGDFFFLSECNDLLFHVQEHRYTPTLIWEMAERHGLVPFQISMTSDRQKAFNEMFPNQSPLNPDLLEKFEAAHPKAFIEMYKVYFYRKGEAKPHRLDSLIMGGNI